MANQQKVAAIYAELQLQTAQFKAALGEATSETRKFTAETRAQMNEAKGAMALLGDEIGVRLPRHLRGFVAELPGVASAMSAAFNAIAVIGLISIVVEAGKKVAEFVQKTEEAAKKNREAWQNTIQPISDTNDKLELTKTKLENAIAKLEHKPQNKIKEAIEEATVAADELGRHLDTDIKKIAEALKGEEHNKLSQIVLHQTGGIAAADIASEVQEKFTQIAAGTFKGTGDQTKDRDAVIQEAIEKAFKKLAPAQKQADQTAANFGGKAPDTSSSLQDVKSLTQLIAGLKGLQTESSLTQDVAKDKGQLGIAAEQKEASTAAAKARGQMIQEMVKANEDAMQQNQRVIDEITKTFVEGQKQEEEAIKKTAEAEKKAASDYYKDQAEQIRQQQIISKQTEEQISNTAKMHAMQAEQAFKTGQLDSHGLSLAKQTIDAQEYADKLAVIAGQIAAIDAMSNPSDSAKNQRSSLIATQSQLTDQSSIAAMIDAQNVLNTTWKGMVDSVWDEMIKKSQDTSLQIKAIATQTIDGINSELAKGMTGKKMDFASVFQGAAQSLAKTSLEKVEGSVLKGFGLGSKRDGSSETNALFVQMAGGGKGAIPGMPSIAGAASKGLMGMLNGSNFFSSLFGGKLFGSGSVFGGGFAAGGDVMGGVPITVGELGPETWVPPSNGHIIPHNQTSSGGFSIGHIDARGTDPAMVNEAVVRGSRMAYAQAMHDSQHAMREASLRTPR